MRVDHDRTAWRRGRLLAAPAVLLSVLTLACGSAQPRAGGSPAVESGSRQYVPDGDHGPAALAIPAIDVTASVVDLGLNADRTLEVPQDYGEAGWWAGGAGPGAPGPAVIAGHVDSRDGPAVFYRLRELVPGDEVRLTLDNGSVVRFVVERLERHPKNDFPTESVYGQTPDPTLRLVTCSGDFDAATGHYVDNTIVFAAHA